MSGGSRIASRFPFGVAEAAFFGHIPPLLIADCGWSILLTLLGLHWVRSDPLFGFQLQSGISKVLLRGTKKVSGFFEFF